MAERNSILFEEKVRKGEFYEAEQILRTAVARLRASKQPSEIVQKLSEALSVLQSAAEIEKGDKSVLNIIEMLCDNLPEDQITSMPFTLTKSVLSRLPASSSKTELLVKILKRTNAEEATRMLIDDYVSVGNYTRAQRVLATTPFSASLVEEFFTAWQAKVLPEERDLLLFRYLLLLIYLNRDEQLARAHHCFEEKLAFGGTLGAKFIRLFQKVRIAGKEESFRELKDCFEKFLSRDPEIMPVVDAIWKKLTIPANDGFSFIKLFKSFMN